MEKNNDNYKNYYPIYGEDSYSKPYTPLNYEDALSQREARTPVYDERVPSFYVSENVSKISGILALMSVVLFILIPIVTGLAFLTDGGIFLFKKTEAQIVEVQEKWIEKQGQYSTYMERVYYMKLSFEYKGKTQTVVKYSSFPHYADGTEYVYVSRIIPGNVMYLDGISAVVQIVAGCILFAAILFAASVALKNYKPAEMNRWMHELEIKQRFKL